MTTTRPPICFIDTETDGLHHGRQAWEIAIIKRHTDPQMPAARADFVAPLNEYDILHVFVDLPSLRTADPYALRLGRFWDRHPVGRELSGKTPVPSDVPLLSVRAAARRVAAFTHGTHIVGVNPTFDTETLAGLLRTEGLTPQWDYHLEDLVAETVGYLRGSRATAAAISPPQFAQGRLLALPDDVTALPWKSDLLAAAVDVEPAPEHERHTALGDARWALRWHDTLAGLTSPAVTS
ncbi:hypothetical protein [Pimelobacter simplex]|uniref:hypothetical protein n=1 Tax=Nocardioides simplex TaxID=2045 RepID=UPI00214F9690|nr:hypothetical protein [Pimelobacter simplex]UUW88368.1 hypothetical protein M0M43_21850 [Pimelobacter simplex]UUW97872.1 hypothetical protein M0M48_10495 [Pimelobacter simplex]